MIVYNEKEAWWKQKISITNVSFETMRMPIRTLGNLHLYPIVDQKI